jgi:ABC-type multidrug transport system permease subunit
MKKVVLTYGFIAGAVVSAFMAVSMISQADHLENMGAGAMIIGYLGMLISFTFIFVAVKNYRDKQNGGRVSFGKAFSIGLLISLIASIMYVITWFFVYNYHMPNFMEGYSAKMITEAKATLSGAALDAEIKEINWFKDVYATPAGFILFTLVEILPVGLLVSLIVALVLKRKRPAVQA